MSLRFVISAQVAALAFIAHSHAVACRPSPDTKYASIEQLVGGSQFVAEVIPKEYIGSGAFRVEVVEWLKGSGPAETSVTGFRLREGHQTSCDFDLQPGEPMLLFLQGDLKSLGIIVRVDGGGMVLPLRAATPQSRDEIRKATGENPR